MQSNDSRQHSRYSGVATTVVAAVLVLYAVSVGYKAMAPAASVPITGNYKVQVKGYAKGTGTCSVSDKVAVDCTLVGEDGTAEKLKATNLKLEGNRFRGDGALEGIKVRISGRVNPPNATISKTQVVATFVSDDGRVGRIIGTHE